ncbi:MAG: chitinase [Pseudobdellovibrionaceae bacterium]
MFLMGLLVTILFQTASATQVAPYFYTWGGAKYNSLSQARRDSTLDNAVYAFGITNGSCALDGSITEALSDIKSYISSGGKLTISFGGANGTYVETACTSENQLFNLIDKVIQQTGTQKLDFDIEGNQLFNVAATQRRTHVLARLQAKYPSLYLSLTLPVSPTGLPSAELNLIKSTVAGGVNINIINIMTMDYESNSNAMGKLSIQSAQNTVKQLATVYNTKSISELYAMLGITPMIGTNDDRTTFSLADAKLVSDFAKQNGVGLISYWAFNRDHEQRQAGSTDLNADSGVVQSDFEYYKIFKTASDAQKIQPPTPSPDPTQTCTSTNWVRGKYYAKGSIVKYTNGKLYIAKYRNPGYSPTNIYYWSPYSCSR